VSLNGEVVSLYDGLEVTAYMDDAHIAGGPDKLVASGVVEKNSHGGWASGTKWCCRIDSRGIRHESEVQSGTPRWNTRGATLRCAGNLQGFAGNWELVAHPESKTIYHFLFK
jgi:hypothetical protein